MNTTNPDFGFFFSVKANLGLSEEQQLSAWNLAVSEFTLAGWTAQQAVTILDSRVGRHLANKVRTQKSISADLRTLLASKSWRREFRLALSQ